MKCIGPQQLVRLEWNCAVRYKFCKFDERLNPKVKLTWNKMPIAHDHFKTTHLTDLLSINLISGKSRTRIIISPVLKKMNFIV